MFPHVLRSIWNANKLAIDLHIQMLADLANHVLEIIDLMAHTTPSC